MINTDRVSEQLRAATLDTDGQRLLVSRLAGSSQEVDLSEPTNCGGLGRIRHFRADTVAPWPQNFLPWLPARQWLGSDVITADGARAQVFQNAACNWRCWYCFVPYDLLRADPDRSQWVSATELVDRYLAVPDRPPVLDLSGGQPDLVPEWAPWTLRALAERGADTSTFLWSDDNLSNDYLFRYVGDDDLALMADHPGYGRVGCLKGFDAQSFAFNTAAAPELFERQLDLAGRIHRLMPKLYLYITLTAPQVPADAAGVIARLVDRIADIDASLVHRVVPLQVTAFTPTLPRIRADQRRALDVQETMIGHWRAATGDAPPEPPRGASSPMHQSHHTFDLRDSGAPHHGGGLTGPLGGGAASNRSLHDNPRSVIAATDQRPQAGQLHARGVDPAHKASAVGAVTARSEEGPRRDD